MGKIYEFRLEGNSILIEKEDEELFEFFELRVEFFLKHAGKCTVSDSKKYAMEKLYGCKYNGRCEDK